MAPLLGPNVFSWTRTKHVDNLGSITKARKLETTLPIDIVRIYTTINCFEVPMKNTKILYIGSVVSYLYFYNTAMSEIGLMQSIGNSFMRTYLCRVSVKVLCYWMLHKWTKTDQRLQKSCSHYKQTTMSILSFQILNMIKMDQSRLQKSSSHYKQTIMTIMLFQI